MHGDLSSPEIPTTAGSDRRDWVEFARFCLGERDYALELGRVERILRDPEVTPVPGTGPGIAGVTNLGSQIPVVVDARALVGLPDRAADAESVLLLLDRGDARPSGLLVDDVVGIESHHVDDVRPPDECDDWEPAVGRRWFRAAVFESDATAGDDSGATIEPDENGIAEVAESSTADADRPTGVFDLDALLAAARGRP